MIIEIISLLLILSGSLLIFIASVGVYRLPDIYLKIHAASKAGTLGCGLILFGVGLSIKSVHGFTEILLLILFIALTNPIGAHLIGRLAHLRSDR